MSELALQRHTACKYRAVGGEEPGLVDRQRQCVEFIYDQLAILRTQLIALTSSCWEKLKQIVQPIRGVPENPVATEIQELFEGRHTKQEPPSENERDGIYDIIREAATSQAIPTFVAARLEHDLDHIRRLVINWLPCIGNVTTMTELNMQYGSPETFVDSIFAKGNIDIAKKQRFIEMVGELFSGKPKIEANYLKTSLREAATHARNTQRHNISVDTEQLRTETIPCFFLLKEFLLAAVQNACEKEKGEANTLHVRFASDETSLTMDIWNDGKAIPPEIAVQIANGERVTATKTSGVSMQQFTQVFSKLASADGQRKGSIVLQQNEQGNVCFRCTIPLDVVVPG